MEPALDLSAEAEKPKVLEFITFTDIQQTNARETKKKVRGHIMRGRQRALKEARAGTEKDAKFVLDTSPLFGPAPARAPVCAPPRRSPPALRGSMLMLSPNFLGRGSIDPFVQYPIEMDFRCHELVGHLRGEWCPMFKTLSKVGFFASIEDPAGFRQILCSSSKHQKQLRNGGPESGIDTDSVESINFSSLAISSVNTRLTDPVAGISDGTITTVLAFITHSIMFGHFDAAAMHLKGLEEIIRRRGGLTHMNLKPPIRTVIFWVDTNVAFVQNTIPRFRFPPEGLLPATPPLSPDADAGGHVLLGICQSDDMTSVMKALRAVNQLIADELAKRNLWQDGLFCGLRMVPVLHRLLTARRRHPLNSPALLIEEACRLAGLLYFSAVRIRFGVPLPPAACCQKLKEVMTKIDEPAWDADSEIIAWLLLLGSISSLKLQDEHDYFVGALAKYVFENRLTHWGVFMPLVREVVWVDNVFDVECHRIRGEVSIQCWQLYHHLFS